MKYYLLSKVSFPIYISIDSREIALGAREKSVELTQEEIESKEVRKYLSKGYVILIKEGVAPMSEPSSSAAVSSDE